MRNRLLKRILPPALIISLLLHLLILLSFTIIITLQPDTEKPKPPHFYTPAYVYKGGITPSITPQKSASKPATAKPQRIQPTRSLAEKHVAPERSNKILKQQSVLSMTYAFLQENQHHRIAQIKKQQDPIYLVGDQNNPADPLIRLLGRALSAHFEYPREAGMFGIRGRAIVGLTLHPNGRLSNIELLESTENQDLDAAAMYAANTAPIVRGADKFISAPKYFVIGFIFR